MISESLYVLFEHSKFADVSSLNETGAMFVNNHNTVVTITYCIFERCSSYMYSSVSGLSRLVGANTFSLFVNTANYKHLCFTDCNGNPYTTFTSVCSTQINSEMMTLEFCTKNSEGIYCALQQGGDQIMKNINLTNCQSGDITIPFDQAKTLTQKYIQMKRCQTKTYPTWYAVIGVVSVSRTNFVRSKGTGLIFSNLLRSNQIFEYFTFKGCSGKTLTKAKATEDVIFQNCKSDVSFSGSIIEGSGCTVIPNIKLDNFVMEKCVQTNKLPPSRKSVLKNTLLSKLFLV